MTAKLEVLFLAHRIPYPPDKGDKIRSWRLFQYLTERYRVHLACFIDDPHDWRHAEYLRSLCDSAVFVGLRPKLAKAKSLTGLLSGEALSKRYFASAEMARAVNVIRRRPLAAEIVFSSTMAQYIETSVGPRPRIVDFCDADSEKWRQYAEEARAPLSSLYKREADTLARTEASIVNWADLSLAITEEEARIINQRETVERKVQWWSNGVDTDYFDPALNSPLITNSADLVFTGAMDYAANVNAVLRFVEDVWPLVRKAAPHTSFAVVGARPVKVIRALHDRDGVIVTGRVDEVRPWLAQAKLVIAPMRVARGLQNKVLEGMAMAKPVIATPEAAAGITSTGKDALCIADSADAMAARVVELLGDEEQRRVTGERARAAVISDYNWAAQLGRFEQLLAPILNVQSSSSSSSSSNSSSILSSAN